MLQLTEPTDTLNAKKPLRTTKMPELQGKIIKFYNLRSADRDVVSETIGLVNKELRTLRE